MDKYNVCAVGVFAASNSTEYDECINYKSEKYLRRKGLKSDVNYSSTKIQF